MNLTYLTYSNSASELLASYLVERDFFANIVSHQLLDFLYCRRKYILCATEGCWGGGEGEKIDRFKSFDLYINNHTSHEVFAVSISKLLGLGTFG